MPPEFALSNLTICPSTPAERWTISSKHWTSGKYKFKQIVNVVYSLTHTCAASVKKTFPQYMRFCFESFYDVSL